MFFNLHHSLFLPARAMVTAVACPILVLLLVTTATAMFAPLKEIKSLLSLSQSFP
jgi:hypothetical protein